MQFSQAILFPMIFAYLNIATASASTNSSSATPNQPTTTSASTWSSYAAYYPALATGLTTDPALSATATTTANQPCPTTPEAGTSCGFLNPEDPCAPQPDGYGPVPSPDTVDSFYNYPAFKTMAESAPTQIPSSTDTLGYVEAFVDLRAVSSAQSFLGLQTLKTYDVVGCAAQCDKTANCTSFNIYIERDPSLNPATNATTYNQYTVWGHNCPNPPSMTSFRCALWGSELNATTATNVGQMREQFQVVFTGSNGYNKAVPALSGSTASSTTSTTSAPVSTSTVSASGSVATSITSSINTMSVSASMTTMATPTVTPYTPTVTPYIPGASGAGAQTQVSRSALWISQVAIVAVMMLLGCAVL